MIRLRRDGRRPLRFVGRLIARHDGQAEAAMLWHDLALYRLIDGGYATAIVAWRASSPLGRPRDVGEPSPQVLPTRCHADAFETLDAALSMLEHHDASGDISPGVSAPALPLDDPGLSPATLFAQAAALHCFQGDVARRYLIGVGVFLAGLGPREI